ncbi:hypothetical protein MAPG_04831 [Magnaporthiopsis poae ATCC 64411]|uniref:Uncharacterized protein n=1 Tax=Magnaporthiopsis poae (strain ATCC 64411 / 73-15) TaxID=644358 RepID=A0A0C4DXS4_MAGP6|nr:hypothetical protein MAPG_04831 [Magnaporthiopsis poae ATCC 64411]
MTLTVAKLETSCPSGGRFYVCDKAPKRFLGCCTVNPCDRGGDCPKGNLTTTTFSADLFEDIPPQDCIGAPGSKSWFTCKANNPPFLGCCSENPCQAKPPGCPVNKLIPARLSDNQTNAAVFLPSSSTPSPTPPPQAAAKGLHPGAIAGIVVGGLLVIALIAGLLFWRRRRNRNRESHIIAEFPAKYINAALPDMGQHQHQQTKDADSSQRGAYGPGPYSPDSLVKPRPSVASSSSTRRADSQSQSSSPWRPAFPDSLASTAATSSTAHHHISMLSSPGDAHGQYARVSVLSDDHSPEPSPRFETIPEGGSTPRFEDPDSVGAVTRPVNGYHGLGERPFLELPGSEATQNQNWRAYKPV